jgi:cytochrome P450/fatty acid desaturase
MDAVRPRYATTHDPYFEELTKRVNAYFALPGRSRRAGPAMWRKSATLVALLVGLATAIYSGRLHGATFVVAFIAWQFVQFLTTIGIAHDATHGAYARSRKVNRWIGRIFDALGIDSSHWIANHLHSHHAAPNVPLRDSAIESFSLVRLHPKTKGRHIHRLQHWYMFAVYSLVTVFQVYFLEPVSFAHRVFGFRREPGWIAGLARMLAKKLAVLGWSLVLPLVVLSNPWSEIATGWLLGHMLCGLALGIIFQTTHLHEGTSFIEPDADGRLPSPFAMHVLATTAEFSVENPIVTWIAGGLNLHVTHHLFPSVSQTHLPALSRIVRQTAREHGAPYVHYSLWGALRSHVRMLRKLGSMPSPGPREAPRLSWSAVLMKPSRFLHARTEILMQASRRHGHVVRLPSLGTPMFVATHPVALQRMFKDNADNWAKSEEYALLAEWIGRGLITTEGELWASDRRILSPAFHGDMVRGLSERIEESARAMLATWTQDREVDVSDEMTRLSLGIIGRKLFGRDISPSLGEIGRLMTVCQEHLTRRMLMPVDFGSRRFRRTRDELRAIVARLAVHPGPGSVAELLSENGFGHEAQIDHLVGFFAAGYETTATSLAWTVFLLTKHSSVQERARHEGGAFLRATIEESMRLYPPVPCFGRRALADDVLMGFRIPAGAKVIVAPHVTHRHPDFWETPEAFDPERFLLPRRNAIPRGAYFPFGLGHRFCVGRQMAMLTSEVTLALALEAFELQPGNGPDPSPVALIALRPDRPVAVRLRSRDGERRVARDPAGKCQRSPAGFLVAS